MFSQKTVFVVGAGASYEYGMPLGSALKDRVADALRYQYQHGFQLVSGDPDLLAHVRRHTSSNQEATNEYTKAARSLADASPSFVSIDEALHFVSQNPKAVEIGKIAIVDQILRAERASALKYDQQTGRPQLPKAGWLNEMLSLALAQTRKEDLNSIFNQLTIVNFNYDRTIEQYLYWALQERTGISGAEAKAIVTNIQIIRPYGSIGMFSEQRDDPSYFGANSYFDPFSRIENLATYTDQAPRHDRALTQTVLIEAHLIVFLGFGYHLSNMDLIQIRGDRSVPTRVLGTIWGIHPSNHDVIQNRLAANLRIHAQSIDLHDDMKAGDLLNQLSPKILMWVGS